MSLTQETNISNNMCNGPYQKDKDSVEELLHTWSTFSTTLAANDTTLVGIAVEICNILTRGNSFDALEVFLARLPKIPEYAKNQDILRSKVSLALKRKQPKVAQSIIKNNTFENGEELVKAWDEAHYMEEEERLQKSLTPLARFRVRKRNPPPNTICPSGIRKMASLPKSATRILKQWLIEHYNDPYPNGEEKIALAKFSGLTSNQVKTWFANARRRIHKGDSLPSGKKNLNDFDPKDNIFTKPHFTFTGDFEGQYAGINLPSNPASLCSPHLTGRGDHSGIGNGYERMPGYTYRCFHSTHNSHACYHCKDMIDDNNNCTGEYPVTDPRCFQFNMNMGTTFPVHPTPTYTFPRWSSYRSPFQCRQDDFDAWYRNVSHQTEIHGHSFEVHADRSSTVGNAGPSLLDQYMHNSNAMQEKADHVDIAASKDELAEVSAARILADLSGKQNYNTQYDQTENILAPNPSV